MPLRLAPIAASVLVLALPATTQAERAVVGGTPLDIRDAPWTVMLRAAMTETSGVYCSGTILDSTHVITAAHCLDLGPRGHVAPEGIVVRAGVTDGGSPRATDALQERTVVRYRVHPGFRWLTTGSPDDVAVLEVTTPFDFGSPLVAAVTLPSTGPQALGAEVSFAGFGQVGRFTPPTLSLVGMPGITAVCKSAATAVILCARSPGASMCPGDSGGALVSRGGGSPVLLGIGSIASCVAGAKGLFTDVRAPEIQRFLLGDDHPPTAPRELTAPRLVYSTPPQVPRWLECAHGTWKGSPTFAYEFRDETGRVLKRSSSPRYHLQSRDVSHRIHCRLSAANAGGVAVEETSAAPKVRSARA